MTKADVYITRSNSLLTGVISPDLSPFRVTLDCPIHGMVRGCFISGPDSLRANEVSKFWVFCEQCDARYEVSLRVAVRLEEVFDEP